MTIQTTAKTNFGNAKVSLYRGYRNAVCVSFVLDAGGKFGGWSVESLLGCTHHTLCLDGGSNLECSNILEVMQAIRDALISNAE